MFRSTISTMVLLLLIGCERVPTDPVVSRADSWFIVTKVNPPKHFAVSFREENTGYQFKNQYVEKHCNSWRKLKVGSRWKLTQVVRQGKKGRYTELEGVRHKFCDKLRAL